MDSDPDWFRIQEGLNDPQKLKEGNKFHSLSAGCFLVGPNASPVAWTSRLYGGLGINILQFLIEKRIKIF